MTEEIRTENTEIRCGICGHKTVMIRGKHPDDEMRRVCPTCLQEKMDFLIDYLKPSYDHPMMSLSDIKPKLIRDDN